MSDSPLGASAPSNLNFWEVFTQFVGGLAGGVVLALASMLVILGFGPPGSAGADAAGRAALFAQVAYVLGVPGGLYMVGRNYAVHGSLWAALLGSLIGCGLVAGLGLGLGLISNFRAYAALFALAGLLAAMLGFNLTRRPRE